MVMKLGFSSSFLREHLCRIVSMMCITEVLSSTLQVLLI